MESNITATDAVYGFMAWLTSREQEVTIGSSYDCAEPCELVKQFLEANDLGIVSENYPNNFVFPKEKENE